MFREINTTQEVADAIHGAIYTAESTNNSFDWGEAERAAGLLEHFCTQGGVSKYAVMQELEYRTTIAPEDGGLNGANWDMVREYL